MFKGIFTLVPLIFLLGSALLLFLVNLNGTTTSSIFKDIYWSQTETGDLTGSNFRTTRWTSYGICDVDLNGHSINCTKHKAAYPYSPQDNFGTLNELPNDFKTSRDTYFYLSRVAYALFLVGLAFTVFAIIPLFLSICCAGGLFTNICAFLVFLAFFFTLAAACLITAVHVLGRNTFSDDNFSSKLGKTLFGLTWASVATLLISFIFTCLIGRSGRKSRGEWHEQDNELLKRHSNDSETSYQRYDTEPTPLRGIHFFKIGRTKNVE